MARGSTAGRGGEGWRVEGEEEKRGAEEGGEGRSSTGGEGRSWGRPRTSRACARPRVCARARESVSDYWTRPASGSRIPVALADAHASSSGMAP